MLIGRARLRRRLRVPRHGLLEICQEGLGLRSFPFYGTLSTALLFLLSIHCCIEVLIRGQFEQVEIFFHLSQLLTLFHFFLQALYFLGFRWVSESLDLPLLVQLELLLLFDFFMVYVVTPFLVSETVHNSGIGRLASLVWLQRLHQLLSTGDGPMESSPDGLRLVHEGVLVGDLDARHNLLPLHYLSVFGR